MRISDWSSDVCSSDLRPRIFPDGRPGIFQQAFARAKRAARLAVVRLIPVIGVGAAILQEALGDQPGILAKRQLDLAGKFRIIAQEGFGVLPALPEALAVIGEPRSEEHKSETPVTNAH